MVIAVRSVRPSVRWAMIVAACFFPFTQKEVREYASQKITGLVPKIESKTIHFTAEELEHAEAYVNSAHYLLYSKHYTITNPEREFARRNLDSELTYEFIRHEDWNTRDGINEVAIIDIFLTRNNPDTIFAGEVALRKDFPIEKRDLFYMRNNPYTKLSDGLRNNPNLKKAIKTFGLDKDPYFAVYLEDEKKK